MGVDMNGFDFFSKIADIMYDVVGILFPGAFCLLITSGILSIDALQNIIGSLGVSYSFNSIYSFGGMTIFLIFSYFYGVLLKGLYEKFFLKEIEKFENEDYSDIKKHKDKLDDYVHLDKCKDDEELCKKIYRECSRKLKSIYLDDNTHKGIVQYLDKYREKINIHRIIYMQIIIIKKIIWLILLIYIVEILSKYQNNYFVNNKTDCFILVAFLLWILGSIVEACLDEYFLNIFERYIKRYFERINRQILIGMENLEKVERGNKK